MLAIFADDLALRWDRKRKIPVARAKANSSKLSYVITLARFTI